MEDPISCYVVGLVDTELLGLVFVLVGISLMRQTQDYIPHAKPSVLQPLPLLHIYPSCVLCLPFLWPQSEVPFIPCF